MEIYIFRASVFYPLFTSTKWKEKPIAKCLYHLRDLEKNKFALNIQKVSREIFSQFVSGC